MGYQNYLQSVTNLSISHKSGGRVRFRCHTEFKVQQCFLRFLVGSHGNTEMKGFPTSLCPPLPLVLALCAGLDWPFGNCFSCPGCLTVAPICSDYMHTEWTQSRTGWLSVTNVLWHPPDSHFILRAFHFLTVLHLEPAEECVSPH